MKWSKKFGRNRVIGTLETVSESHGENEDLDLIKLNLETC